jgi:serine/threonine-protein kinase
MSRSGRFQAPPGFRDSPHPAVNPGDVVASAYTVRCEVARTDTGVVYEARDLIVERPVALKLAWRDPGTPSLVAEARRCAQVRAPCAVAIHGIGNHHGIELVVAERVTGVLLREVLRRPQPPEAYLARLRSVIAAVTRAHEHGIAIGDLSAETILLTHLIDNRVDRDIRVVLGRLSLSQVPAHGPVGQILAPEVVSGDALPGDPEAAEAIDLYGLGCLAIELACGAPPFQSDDRQEELRGHELLPPPRLAELRPELPGEASDLVEWLLAKQPAGRPPSAADVLAQLDALIERLGATARSLRVLVVVEDTARARWLRSLARRAHAGAIVEIASEGTDAAHKLHRDRPDLVLVDAALRGVMNALELCMYVRGIAADDQPELVLVGDLAERERALFDSAAVTALPESPALPSEIIDHVRRLAAGERRRRKPTTVIG